MRSVREPRLAPRASWPMRCVRPSKRSCPVYRAPIIQWVRPNSRVWRKNTCTCCIPKGNREEKARNRMPLMEGSNSFPKISLVHHLTHSSCRTLCPSMKTAPFPTCETTTRSPIRPTEPASCCTCHHRGAFTYLTQTCARSSRGRTAPKTSCLTRCWTASTSCTTRMADSSTCLPHLMCITLPARTCARCISCLRQRKHPSASSACRFWWMCLRDWMRAP